MIYLLTKDWEMMGLYESGLEAKMDGYQMLEEGADEIRVFRLTEVCHANHDGKTEQEMYWEEDNE